MHLQQRKYTKIDVLRIPFSINPFLVILKLGLTVIEAIVSTFVLALATASFVDGALAVFEGQADISSIALPLGLLLAVICFVSVSGSLSQLIGSKIKFNLDLELVPAILEVEANLAYKHIEDEESWELIERVSDEMTETFMDGISAYEEITRSLVAILSIIGLILTQIGWAALIIIAFSIPLFAISLWAGKQNYAAKVETRKYERRYSYYSDDVLTNREAVEERTLFGYVDKVNQRYHGDFEKARKIQLKVLLKTRLAMKSTSISLIIITLLTALPLIKSVIAGQVSPGMFMGIISALFGMVETLGWQLQDASKNISETELYMEDLTTLVHLEPYEGATSLPDEEAPAFESLEFVEVSFKYPKQKDYILKDLSFSIEAGQHYAFVGVNGAGKTTITKLLTGLYRDYEGDIFINGKELRLYPASTLKALFSVVYQDFSRYQISMADAIRLGDTAKQRPANHLLDAVSKSGLASVVSKLYKGADTPLGKIDRDGVDISGGEWQKVALARSLYSRAPIKILDEPTSALDPIAENHIYKKFEGLMAGKTTIFISHRLGSTKLANTILVIDKGRVAESGTHGQLIAAKGLYANMFETQKEWYQ